MKRIASKHDDEGVKDESYDKEYFSKGCPKFRFPVPLNGKDID
jgi:hypothetical protein